MYANQRLHLQLFLSDPDAKFSKSIGWADNASGRTGRYAIVVDHGKVRYADIETEKGAVKVRHPIYQGYLFTPPKRDGLTIGVFFTEIECRYRSCVTVRCNLFSASVYPIEFRPNCVLSCSCGIIRTRGVDDPNDIL